MSNGKEDSENENKVIFIGESGVGKTSLIKVSIGQQIDLQHTLTLTASYFSKKFIYNNQKYNFHLWDTIGQEKYRALTRMFFKDANIVILVYDITNKKSFESLDLWLDQVKNEIGDDFILAVVGNKSDLFYEEEVSENQGKEYAKKKCAKFKLCSAKDNPADFIVFLEQLFEEFLIKTKNISKVEQTGITIDKKNIKNNNKGGKCC